MAACASDIHLAAGIRNDVFPRDDFAPFDRVEFPEKQIKYIAKLIAARPFIISCRAKGLLARESYSILKRLCIQAAYVRAAFLRNEMDLCVMHMWTILNFGCVYFYVYYGVAVTVGVSNFNSTVK